MAKRYTADDDDKPEAEQLPAPPPVPPAKPTPLPAEPAAQPVLQYPKWIRRKDKDGAVLEEKVVQTAEEEKAAGKDWS